MPLPPVWKKKSNQFTPREHLIFASAYNELAQLLRPHSGVAYQHGEDLTYPVGEVLNAIEHVILLSTDSKLVDIAARSRRILDDVARQRYSEELLAPFVQPDNVRRDIARARLLLDQSVFSKISTLRDQPAGPTGADAAP